MPGGKNYARVARLQQKWNPYEISRRHFHPMYVYCAAGIRGYGRKILLRRFHKLP